MKPKTIAVAVALAASGAVAVDTVQNQMVLGECDQQAPALKNIDTELRTLKVDDGFLKTRGLNVVERGAIKSCQIMKKMRPGQYTIDGIRVDIQSITIEDDAVIVFAKAYDRGKQIGFGTDGTVDIERFRIFNPPILVADNAGTIVITSTNENGVEETTRWREDPEEALKQAIVNTIKAKKLAPANIIPGKVGATTDTYYATTNDGYVYVYAAGTYSGARDATTGTADNTYPNDANIIHNSKITTYYVSRAQFDFNIDIGSDTINSASLSLWSVATGGNDGDSDTAILLNHTSNGNINNPLQGEDMNDFGSTSIGSETYANLINQDDYVTIALTDTSAINTSGTTIIGIRSLNDINNVTPTGINNLRTRLADYTGTANDPFLTIDHSSGVGLSTSIESDFIFFE